MQRFDAWHLPGLNEAELTFVEREFGDLPARVPQLTPAQLHRVLDHIAVARRALRPVPIERIVGAIDRAAHTITQDTDTSALLQAATGYSRETIADVLAHMSEDWSASSLEKLLEQEHAGSNVTGPQLAFHIFAGNVPGVAVTSIIRSLLVRAATLGKTASGEPVLPVLFARALAHVDATVADTLAVTYWPGGAEELERVALERCDVAVVYGGADTVRSVTERAPPETRLVVHGPRISLGIVGRDATESVAADIARATAAYDQQGCVSPHVVYAERGGSLQPRDLARAVARELELLAAQVPRRRVSASEAIAIREARTRAEFSEDGTEVFASEDTSYTVILDVDVKLVASCLNRTLYIKPIDDALNVAALLQPHRHLVQSVALEGFDEGRRTLISSALFDAGVTRITTFARLPWPPMWWHHDGRGPLRELLFWHDVER